VNAAARAAAVVPAAGRGERLGGDTAKPFVMLCGRPLLQYALTALEQVPQIETVAVVVAVDAVPRAREIVRRTRLRNVTIVTGGPDRQASVKRGLDALPPGPDLVLVHDGARPLLSPALASAVLSAAERDGAATAALPVSETVKRGEDGWVRETLDRGSLHRIQTPQAFKRALLLRAHDAAMQEGFRGTDDAMLVERLGERVRLVAGDPSNLKVTVPEDLALAEALLARKDALTRPPRVGIGFDAHRFGPGGRLVLGGVEIPFTRGLLGHSDADVVVHAVMDALLGAAGCGDIGRHFPPTDSAYRGARSLDLLARVCDLLAGQGWRPAYVDVVVMAEAPHLTPHVSRMQAAMSPVLGLATGSINIKATTLEGMGPIGREEGIAAQAVATLEAVPVCANGGR